MTVDKNYNEKCYGNHTFLSHFFLPFWAEASWERVLEEGLEEGDGRGCWNYKNPNPLRKSTDRGKCTHNCSWQYIFLTTNSTILLQEKVPKDHSKGTLKKKINEIWGNGEIIWDLYGQIIFWGPGGGPPNPPLGGGGNSHQKNRGTPHPLGPTPTPGQGGGGVHPNQNQNKKNMLMIMTFFIQCNFILWGTHPKGYPPISFQTLKYAQRFSNNYAGGWQHTLKNVHWGIHQHPQVLKRAHLACFAAPEHQHLDDALRRRVLRATPAVCDTPSVWPRAEPSASHWSTK